MSYYLNSLKGIKEGIIVGAVKGDTRSLDYGYKYYPKGPSIWHHAHGHAGPNPKNLVACTGCRGALNPGQENGNYYNW